MNRTLLVLALALGGCRRTRPAYRPTSANTYKPAVTAPSVDAFERGGTPPRDSALEALLLDLERALAHGDRVIEKDPPAIVARGEAVAEAWRLFADAGGCGERRWSA